MTTKSVSEAKLNLPWNCREIGTSGVHNEFTVCEIEDFKGNRVATVCEPFASFIVNSCNRRIDALGAIARLIPYVTSDERSAKSVEAAQHVLQQAREELPEPATT